MSTVDATRGVTAQSLGATVDLVVIGLVIGLLIFKEVSTAVPTPRARILGRILDIGLMPLLLVYGVLVASRLLAGG